MTILEIIEERRKAQKEIEKIIEAFENKTNVKVSSIDLSTYNTIGAVGVIIKTLNPIQG